MNHYPHHIGDFDKATRHLTRIERSIYRDLIELYYDTEQPLTLDRAALCRKIIARSNEEVTAVEQTLNEFFTETSTGWYHERCEAEIERYRNNNSQKAMAGKASAAKKAAKRQQTINGCSTPVEQTNNGTPTNQEPEPEPVKTLGANAPVNSAEEPAQVDPLPDKLPQCPVQQIVDLYHEKLPANPRVRVLDDARRKAIGARWRQAAKMDVRPFGYETGPDGLKAWARFFEVCAESDFLTGKTDPRPGAPVFVADIDFLMSASGFKKCLENKYHRGAQ